MTEPTGIATTATTDIAKGSMAPVGVVYVTQAPRGIVYQVTPHPPTKR